MNYRLTSVLLASILVISCSAISKNSNEFQECSNLECSNSKIEVFNRAMFDFNHNVLDHYILRPVALAWYNYIPAPARTGLGNFLSNLNEPYTMINYFFEGKFYKGVVHFNRFFLNTFLGIGGFIDTATMAHSKLTKEETHTFGNTLGYYNISYGTYIEMPGYGGFTPREDIGSLVDNIYPPLSWLTFWMRLSKWALEGIEMRAQLLGSDSLIKNSKDPYYLIKRAYFQRHDFFAKDAKIILAENPNALEIQDELNDIDHIKTQ